MDGVRGGEGNLRDVDGVLLGEVTHGTGSGFGQDGGAALA
jgi:hypothetical protein